MNGLYRFYRNHIKRYIPRRVLNVILSVFGVHGFANEQKHIDQSFVVRQPYASCLRVRKFFSTRRLARQLLTRVTLMPNIFVLIDDGKLTYQALMQKMENMHSDYVLLVNPSDHFFSDTLLQYTAAVCENPDAKIVYGDYVVRSAGRMTAVYLPHFSPYYFQQIRYIPHTALIHISVIRACQRLPQANEEFMTEAIAQCQTKDVLHIPAFLTSISPAAYQLLNAVRPVVYTLQSNALVSIIIPTKDHPELLRACIESIARYTKQRYEILIVNNQSERPEMLKYLAELRTQHTVIDYSQPFDYAAMNNLAASQANGAYLLLLNDDIVATDDGWLEQMVALGSQSKVGVVGAKLVYPNGAIQHAGLCLTSINNGVTYYWHKYLRSRRKDGSLEPGYLSSVVAVREVAAVTGACLLIKKQLFDELNGFDSELHIGYNDVDLCLRARELGYSVLYTPYAELIHHESMTRKASAQVSMMQHPEDSARFIHKWRHVLEKGDPYVNSKLSIKQF
ncbi:MAG: glycosyltransferase family 2 protein [Candidatus Kerfeldbacteria bacterium]|nr:glycosyltransferase family 2 protein [Candidatus Kerfeldbacteria bacterium]